MLSILNLFVWRLIIWTSWGMWSERREKWLAPAGERGNILASSPTGGTHAKFHPQVSYSTIVLVVVVSGILASSSTRDTTQNLTPCFLLYFYIWLHHILSFSINIFPTEWWSCMTEWRWEGSPLFTALLPGIPRWRRCCRQITPFISSKTQQYSSRSSSFAQNTKEVASTTILFSKLVWQCCFSLRQIS